MSERQHGGRASGAPSIRGIVFDAVGTLIEARPSVAAAYLVAAEAQGVRLDRDLVRQRFRAAFGLEETHEERGRYGSDDLLEQRRWRRIVTEVLPEVADPGRAFERLWAHFAEPGNWSVPEDAAGAVAMLARSGLPIRVASNFDARLHPVLAGHASLAALESTAVISSEVGYRKPHPAFYRAVCESLGVPASATLWIGDDLENDVLGPRSEGFQVALIDRMGRTERSLVPAGVPVARDLRELAASVETSAGGAPSA